MRTSPRSSALSCLGLAVAVLKSSSVRPARYASTTIGLTVRGARDSRSVSELAPDRAHHRREGALRVTFALRRPAPRELRCRNQGPAPRPEVLRCKAVAHVLGDVAVEVRSGERHEATLSLVAEEPRVARELEQLGDAARQRLTPHAAPDELAVLPAEGETHFRVDHRDVSLRERRDAVRARSFGVAVGARAKSGLVDEPDGERARPVALVALATQISRSSGPDHRKSLGEVKKPVELRLLLRCPVPWVVAVLLPLGGVDARGLDMRARVRRDPDVLPGRRDDERSDASELLRITYLRSGRVDVAEATPPQPSPVSTSRHEMSSTPGGRTCKRT